MRPSFPLLMSVFAAYSYGATVVSAAWFLRRDHGLELTASLGWAALLFSPWIVIGLMVWTILRLSPSPARAILILTGLAPPVVPLAAASATIIDGLLRDAGWSVSEIITRTIDRLPVAILLYTAVTAAGLAAAWWLRSDRQRREMQALAEALDALRTDQPPASNTPTNLIVSVGRRRIPVSRDEIEWVSSAGNYVVVHWRDQEGLLRETLQQLEVRLETARFARGHRSTLINLARVADLRPLSDGA